MCEHLGQRKLLNRLSTQFDFVLKSTLNMNIYY